MLDQGGQERVKFDRFPLKLPETDRGRKVTLVVAADAS